MMSKPCILIAGAGGIGQAVGLLLAEYASFQATYFIGDRNPKAALTAAQWITEGNTNGVTVYPFLLDAEQVNPVTQTLFYAADLVLDCLPGSCAPRVAKWARDYDVNYINLTEHVAETQQIIDLAQGADTAFVLQTGLAPGFVNVLAMDLYQQFCQQYGEQAVEYVGMKVGALSLQDQSPHHYGLTWSPIGVATEYCRDATIIRDYQLTTAPALTDTERICIDGQPYEADLTSGGAADLPMILAGRVRTLDYKTLRYPGHFNWVRQLLANAPPGTDPVAFLETAMREVVPLVKEDTVVIYAVVQGYDPYHAWQTLERTYHIYPRQVGKRILRAIQVATAAPMAECAELILTSHIKGVILPGEMDPAWFFKGAFIPRFYEAARITECTVASFMSGPCNRSFTSY